ncbi:helix-turn-helix transcriptional regulator [Ruminococcaceae bacterium OttesenSCG-928-D13]|nr:helix-turn-helix transcriptional regulator [Ruminococcaceae bacterium OttesenSCG-928-D13]
MAKGIQQAFVRQLKVQMKARKITAYRLAYDAGVPYSTVKSILDGKSRATNIVTIKKLLDAMKLSVPDFFSADDFAQLEQEIK